MSLQIKTIFFLLGCFILSACTGGGNASLNNDLIYVYLYWNGDLSVGNEATRYKSLDAFSNYLRNHYAVKSIKLIVDKGVDVNSREVSYVVTNFSKYDVTVTKIEQATTYAPLDGID